MGAVIDPKAFEKIESYIEAAKTDAQATLVFGGACDDTDGYFIQPTLIETADPAYRTMCEEIFGPVLSLYVYPDRKSTRLNSSHGYISYAVFCLKKKNKDGRPPLSAYR